MKDLRNEAILEELRNEGSLIRSTIKQGFSDLSFTINSNFSSLSNQLARQHNEVVTKIGSGISSQLSSIEAEQKLTNGLNQSINKSSIEAGKSLRNIEQYMYLNSKR